MAEWVIVLAGGEGKRMQESIRRRFGRPYPKQYCSFRGDRSLLEHTIERACSLVAPERVVTVIRRRHRVFLSPRGLRGRVVEQPASRDTAPGLLYPTSYILARDPDAVIHVFPSDHFIYPNDRFIHQVREASSLVNSYPERIVLMGARPDGPETDYGWIQPGEPVPGWSHRASAVPRAVLGFSEKPEASQARFLFARRCLWNTFIFSCRLQTLWTLAGRYLPDIQQRFSRFAALIPELERESEDRMREAVANLFSMLPSENLSRRLFNRAARHCLVLPMRGLVWSDWGRPERVEQTLQFIERDRRSAGRMALA